MRRRRPARAAVPALTLTVALVLAGGCGSATEDRSAGTTTAGSVPAALPASSAVAVDFVLRATAGSLALAGDGGRLVLTGAGPEVVAFSDRPARLDASVPVAQMLHALGLDGQPDDPPNAALAIDGGPTVVVELLDATWDRAAATVAFGLRLFDRQGHLPDGSSVAPPAAFGPAALFIDDLTVDDAVRSFQATVVNRSDQALAMSASVVHGWWDDDTAPQGVLAPGGRTEWGVESAGFMTGAEATFTLTGTGPEPLQIYADVPFLSDNVVQVSGGGPDLTATLTPLTTDPPADQVDNLVYEIVITNR